MPVIQIFYSMLLTIAKTSAPLKRRLLQEMKSSGANKHCRNVKHKQDTLGSLCGLIRPGDFFLLWDLRDMFHQVSVHPTMRPMLRALVWKIVRLATGQKTTKLIRVQNTTLSQGACPSPGIGTKMLADPMRKFAAHGVRVRIKVDDICAVVTGYKEWARVGFMVSKFLTLLGAKFSDPAKCQFRPCVRVEWNGAAMCSVAGVTMQLKEKVVKMVRVARELREALADDRRSVSPHLLMKTKGVLKAAIEQVEGARLMCLEMQQLENWLMANTVVKEQWVKTMEIPRQLRWAVVKECEEWMRDFNPEDPVRIPWNGKLNFFEEPAAVIWSDACNYQKGWRVTADQVRGYPEIKVQVPMSEAEMDDHITLQETSAGSDALMDVMKKRDLRIGGALGLSCFRLESQATNPCELHKYPLSGEGLKFHFVCGASGVPMSVFEA